MFYPNLTAEERGPSEARRGPDACWKVRGNEDSHKSETKNLSSLAKMGETLLLNQVKALPEIGRSTKFSSLTKLLKREEECLTPTPELLSQLNRVPLTSPQTTQGREADGTNE